MAEKDYDTWLAGAKAALDGYSAEQKAIAALYEQAKQNAANAYDAKQKQLASQTVQSKNRAAIDTKRTERNIGQTLASRGLAFSGENAQTHLDLNLSLQNRLAEIDRDAQAQSQELESEKADALQELELAQAEARSDSAQKRAELQNELAHIASQKEAQTQNSTEKQPETEDKQESAPQSTLPNLKGKPLGERVRLMLEYAAKQQAQNKAETAYTPDISAHDLAKQLVSSAGGKGYVSGYRQQDALAELLSALEEEHAFDSAYYNELLLNLRSMGYRSDYKETTDREIEVLCEGSGAVYTDFYDRYYKMYQMIGHPPADSDQMAGELALFQQLVYLYERSESKERFELAVESLGMKNELKKFYQKIKVSDGKYKLGGEVIRK